MKRTRTSKAGAFRRLAALYKKMDKAYAAAADPMGFTCDGCGRNCCVSYFQHHTHVEWLYLFEGMNQLPEHIRAEFMERARENVRLTGEALGRGEIPSVMCPLNVDGRCGLYMHRLMICRLHGVPNLLLQGGVPREFSGCWRAQELCAANPDYKIMDRTPLYRELAQLELDLLGPRRARLPKVDMTLAEMLVSGPPKL